MMRQNPLAGANVPARVAIAQQSFPPEFARGENPNENRQKEKVGKRGRQQPHPAPFEDLLHLDILWRSRRDSLRMSHYPFIRQIGAMSLEPRPGAANTAPGPASAPIRERRLESRRA